MIRFKSSTLSQNIQWQGKERQTMSGRWNNLSHLTPMTIMIPNDVIAPMS